MLYFVGDYLSSDIEYGYWRTNQATTADLSIDPVPTGPRILAPIPRRWDLATYLCSISLVISSISASPNFTGLGTDLSRAYLVQGQRVIVGNQ